VGQGLPCGAGVVGQGLGGVGGVGQGLDEDHGVLGLEVLLIGPSRAQGKYESSTLSPTTTTPPKEIEP
jgi:hypothetical protein